MVPSSFVPLRRMILRGTRRAVLRRREHAQHFHVVEVDRARHLERGRHALAVGEPVELHRRHVGLDAVEQVVAHRLDLVHGRDTRQRQVALRRARHVEHAHARRPAREIADVHAPAEEHERILAAELGRDHVLALRHERRRALEVERSRSESPDLAARRTGSLGDQVQGAVRPEARIRHAVLETGHLHEATVLAAHVVRELAAVALLHGHQQCTGLVEIVEPDLGDLRQAVPEDLHIVLLVLAEAVEPDRLVEVLLIGRPVRTRIARVPESLAVRRPRDVAAGGRVLHARDRLADLLACCHVEDIEAAVLAATLRQRHRDPFAVRRRLEPVERDATRRIELVGVEHDTGLRRVGVLPHHDDHRLLELRVRVHRKQLATLCIEARRSAARPASRASRASRAAAPGMAANRGKRGFASTVPPSMPAPRRSGRPRASGTDRPPGHRAARRPRRSSG